MQNRPNSGSICNMRYFVGFLITIGLIIVLILMLFGGGSKKSKTPTISTKTLVSYADSSAEARMTVDGPVNADSTHNRFRINVTKNEVIYQQMKGYEGAVVKNTRYDNNKDAYAYFLRALSIAGFTQGNPDKQAKDERGYCPLGNRYVFEFIQDGKTIERYWATNCGKPATYLGSRDLTIQLFEKQVPDFEKVNLTRDLQ